MASVNYYIYISKLASPKSPLGGLMISFTNKLGHMLVSNEFFSLAVDNEYLDNIHALSNGDKGMLCQYLFTYYSTFKHLTNKGKSRELVKQSAWPPPLDRYSLYLVRPRTFLIAVHNALRDKQVSINRHNELMSASLSNSMFDVTKCLSKSTKESIVDDLLCMIDKVDKDTNSNADGPIPLFQVYSHLDAYPKVCAELSNILVRNRKFSDIIDTLYNYITNLQGCGYDVSMSADIVVSMVNTHLDRVKANVKRIKESRRVNDNP